MTAIAVRGRHVLLPAGPRPAIIHIRDGRIAAIGAYEDPPSGIETIDAGELWVLPGLVDTHVHLNDPGRDEWEGVTSGTRAAAAGGVTTIVDMPLNSIPATTSVAALDAKLRAASGRCHVDVAFWGGVVPGNTPELDGLAARGACGFKCFLAPSGVAEFEHVAEADLRRALPVLARLRLPLLVHAELPSALRDPAAHDDPRSHATWLRSRPEESEHAAIALMISLAREFATPVHIVHLAASGALPALNAARAEGVPITVETCPHYLSFAAEEIEPGATAFKCAPPIRERLHREALWQALERREIDLVATDHSPAPPALKHLDDGNVLLAWGGIASLQLGLRAVWTGAAARGIGIGRVVQVMADAPARLAGLDHSKGTIAPGRDADVVIWDPDAKAAVDAAALEHRHPVTPYHGMQLEGCVRKTLLRGEVVYDDGAFAPVPRGKHLPRRR